MLIQLIHSLEICIERQIHHLLQVYLAVLEVLDDSGPPIQPLGDRIVLEREDSQDTTAGGIVLPESAKDKPARGIVLSVGPGKPLDDGSRAEVQVQVLVGLLEEVLKARNLDRVFLLKDLKVDKCLCIEDCQKEVLIIFFLKKFRQLILIKF